MNLPFLSSCLRKGMKLMPIMNGWRTSGTLPKQKVARINNYGVSHQ